MTTDTRNIRNARELIEFVRLQTASRGWGRGLRNAVSEWYMRQPLSKLAVEVLPDLPLHRQIVRKAHPKPRTLAQNAFFQWVTTGELGHLATPELRAELTPSRAPFNARIRTSNGDALVTPIFSAYAVRMITWLGRAVINVANATAFCRCCTRLISSNGAPT